MAAHVNTPLTPARLAKDIFYFFIAVTFATLGLEAFIVPNGSIDGGVVGISLLCKQVLGFPLEFGLVLFNLPFIILGYKVVSPTFAVKSLICIAALSFALSFVYFDILTDDKLLAAVFGGFLVGAGVGFAIRGGGVLDGTEILAIYLERKTGLGLGDIVLVINIIIFAVAGIYMGLEPALYSVLTYFAAAKAIDFVVHGLEEYSTITIISNEYEKIKDELIHEMGQSVTMYLGKSGYSGREIYIIKTVVTRLKITTVKDAVLAIDPKALISVSQVDAVQGGNVAKNGAH